MRVCQGTLANPNEFFASFGRGFAWFCRAGLSVFASAFKFLSLEFLGNQNEACFVRVWLVEDDPWEPRPPI
jgi:hypothetical protein